MPGRRWAIGFAVVCALLAAGCGDSKDDTPKLTRAQSDALVAQLERARVTAAAHDVAGTTAALNAFRNQVARLRRAGAISSATAKALRTGAIRALQRANADSGAAAPVETQTTPVPPRKKKHPGKGSKRKTNHGKGKEGDD